MEGIDQDELEALNEIDHEFSSKRTLEFKEEGLNSFFVLEDMEEDEADSFLQPAPKLQESPVELKPFSKEPESGQFFTVKSLRGQMYHFPSKTFVASKVEEPSDSRLFSLNKLVDQIEADLRIQEINQAAERNIDRKKERQGEEEAETQLFVDKYAAKKFTELLSNDKSNVENLLVDLKKVLLISGPAGLGKTTLCHVIGKMCGYNVIEINASEDRSGEDVKRRIIESATSLCIRDKKPNLLVIDEIDGALEQGSLISTLIELCSSQHASNTTDSDEKPTKKRKIKQALNSPIICICNEPYVPALKALRKISHHVQMKKTFASKLAQRLAYVCRQEGIVFDNQALLFISEYTECDMRAALNALQFSVKKCGKITMETLMDEEKGLMIGLKDFCKSPFTLIEEIFSSSPVTSIKANNQKKRQNSKRLLGLIEGSSGDCQKILSGCNEAYLHFPFTDASFSKIIEIGEWNCFANQAINETYACYGILAYHLLFSSEKEREYVNYFKRDSDAYYEGQQNGAILKSLLPFFKVNMEELRLIVIPALLQLIDPFSIESNNPQLLKQKERKTIDSIVGVMRETGLNYLQKKDEQSESYYYILDPPLESLVLAKDEAKLKDKYSIKQFISQLIDKQSILTGVFPKNSLVRKNENRVASEMKGVFGNTVHSASADRAQKKFDRKTKISFRFNEGYSNAVKKVVRIKDFM